MRFFLISLLIGQIGVAQALNSLMMRPQEIAIILQNRKVNDTYDQSLESSQAKHLFCKGIVYIDDTNWQVWLEDEIITSETSQSKYKVIAVHEDSISYQGIHDGVTYHATIMPNHFHDDSTTSTQPLLVQAHPKSLEKTTHNNDGV